MCSDNDDCLLRVVLSMMMVNVKAEYHYVLDDARCECSREYWQIANEREGTYLYVVWIYTLFDSKSTDGVVTSVVVLSQSAKAMLMAAATPNY